MKFFKKKRSLKAVAAGQLIPLEQVNDEVFSTNMIGPGFAIINHSGEIFSPVVGKVQSIFPTLHAITIESKSGETLLVHMGLDTVELSGEAFSIYVEEGDNITCDTLLAKMDLPLLVEKEKDTVVIVVLPELSEGELMKENVRVFPGESVFSF